MTEHKETKATGDTEQAGTSTRSIWEEWTALGKSIESQIRRDVARMAGAQESDNWGAIGRKAESKVRQRLGGGGCPGHRGLGYRRQEGERQDPQHRGRRRQVRKTGRVAARTAGQSTGRP